MSDFQRIRDKTGMPRMLELLFLHTGRPVSTYILSKHKD